MFAVFWNQNAHTLRPRLETLIRDCFEKDVTNQALHNTNLMYFATYSYSNHSQF